MGCLPPLAFLTKFSIRFNTSQIFAVCMSHTKLEEVTPLGDIRESILHCHLSSIIQINCHSKRIAKFCIQYREYPTPISSCESLITGKLCPQYFTYSSNSEGLTTGKKKKRNMNDSRGFIVPQTLIVLQFVLVFDVCQ